MAGMEYPPHVTENKKFREEFMGDEGLVVEDDMNKDEWDNLLDSCDRCKTCNGSLPLFLWGKSKEQLLNTFDKFGRCLAQCERCNLSEFGDNETEKKAQKLRKNIEKIGKKKGDVNWGNDEIAEILR